MTPKEKAEELIKKFTLNPVGPIYIMSDEHTKQCALIAVDEVINVLDDENLYIQGETNIVGFINYFNEVKQHIQQL